jgi:hypothetical protein
MRPVDSGSWWEYDGPLAIVFTGLADGTLVLPVRLPTAPCNQAILDHHLNDPSRWHKVDLVRTRDPNAAGGWRYEAHLMVLTKPYASPRTLQRRARVAVEAIDRIAGIDVNVSNLTIASHVDGASMRVTRIERDAAQKQRDRGRSRRERRQQRQIERSRRGTNRAEYRLSKRQEKRARRRAAAGLASVEVIPMGPRVPRADRSPLQLSKSYRRRFSTLNADAVSAAQARRDRTRRIAADVVATHGYSLIVEANPIASWSRSWGAALAAFAPGMLLDAIAHEACAVAAFVGGHGGVQRVSTHATALSRHCPCGQRVDKTLRKRTHRCLACGLVGDRDAVSAILASFVTLVPDRPSSAQVNYGAAAAALPNIRRALRNPYSGWQDTLSESTDLSAREGPFLASWTSTPDLVAVARRTVGTAPYPILNESCTRWTTSERAALRTNMSSTCGLYRPQLAGHLLVPELSTLTVRTSPGRKLSLRPAP